ncbi:MAG: FGGY family carbohydrate kinase [Thermomicrobiales bacterium]
MNSASEFLTVDVGTSGLRVAVFDANLTRIAQAQRPIPRHAAVSMTELDVDALWAAVVAGIAEVADGRKSIAAVGVSAQLGVVPCDARGEALRPALLWADRRAAVEAGEIAGAYGVSTLYQLTGRRVDAELPAPKLRWLQCHEPDLWRRTRVALSLKDYLVHRLSGVFVTDPAHASYSLLFDVGAGHWDESILRDLGLEAAAVPVLAGAAIAGTITPDASRLTGVPTGTPVIVGGPDGSAGAVGAGLTHPGASVDISGTTDVFFTAIDRAIFDPAHRVVLNAALIPGLWSLGGPMGMTGGMLRWFVTELVMAERGDTEPQGGDFALIDEYAALVPPGAAGLVALPAMTGERAPTWDRWQRGAILGLTPEHSRAHVARAMLEGSAYVLRELIDAVAMLGVPVGEIRLSGGGAASPLWTQIRADVCERPFAVVREREASSLGTAILAAVAVGHVASVADAAPRAVRIDRVMTPAPERAAVYRSLWPVARSMARHLTADFAALNAALRSGDEPPDSHQCAAALRHEQDQAREE